MQWTKEQGKPKEILKRLIANGNNRLVRVVVSYPSTEPTAKPQQATYTGGVYENKGGYYVMRSTWLKTLEIKHITSIATPKVFVRKRRKASNV